MAYLGARSEERKQQGVVLTWTEHRLGELLVVMAERGERASRGRRSKSFGAKDLPPTTHDLLSGTPSQAENLAHRAWRLAKVPAKDIERIAAKLVATATSVTPANVLAQATRDLGVVRCGWTRGPRNEPGPPEEGP